MTTATLHGVSDRPVKSITSPFTMSTIPTGAYIIAGHQCYIR